MNLRGFEQDFTKDLESFVKRHADWEPITPLKAWSAKKTAAPERHKILGFECGLSPQTQIYMLDNENTAFEIIESMLRMYLSPIEYSTSDPFSPIDVEAEQVWLFAMRWMEHYYECLMEPLAIRTEFYKQSHMKFLDLMRMMLVYNPKKRISFGDALKFWYPGSSVFLESSLNEEDSSTTTDPYPLVGDTKGESSDECHSLPQPAEGNQVENSTEHHTPPPASESPPSYCTSQVSVPNVVLPALPSSAVSSVPTAVTSVRSRLALKRSDGLVGHNKTRKSPRNLGRSPAIGNRGTRVRG